jgi:NAD(P)-dependent dehydrogenase (short-subunit alcohol dehydrogenase family)
MFDFQGKTVVVTGGTSGIGRQAALAFLHAGASVIAAGLDTQETLPAEIRREILDIHDAAALQSLFDGLPPLHALVNAAGIIRRDDEFKLDVFADVIEVNLTGTMRACMAAHSKLRAGKGSVLNFASMYSFFGAPRAPAYSASKAAIALLTKSLAVAWGPEGIRVNAVAPGWIATTLTQALRDDPARSAPILSRTPFGRWGKPEEIVGPILFLASEAASFVTGAILPVDGGYSAG